MSKSYTLIPSVLKKCVKRTFGVFGLELCKKKSVVPRFSLIGALQQASSSGLSPATVIDVGAAYGEFTLRCSKIFPESRYLLVEPLQEYRSCLERTIETIPKAEYILAAANARSGEVVINVHADLVGSSIYLEHEDSNVNGAPRVVTAETLDNVCRDRNAPGPYLIKVDVQGAELNVLSGAKEVLKETEYVILEVSLFEFFEGGPQLYDVMHYMRSCGFAAYEVFGVQYRLLDNAMSQIDMAFVRDKGRFRKFHFYATREQRERQNEEMLKTGNRGILQ